MNCAITLRQPGTHPAPVSTTVATTKPATAPEAAKSIRSTDDLIKEFIDRFMGIGRFPGKYKIWLHHAAHPMMHDPRKCPIALHPKVKEHLDKMECLGMITHVDEPTDWVSSITYVQKANGELCLCLDPHDLNEAICHDHHKMPTVEEVAHEFAHSCFFTKLDACHGYWSVILDQDSSLLTTFNGPFGRYHFLWLPFGLVCSPKHLPEEDGSDPWRVPRMYWNCRQHHGPWPHWGRTWCPPTRSHADCPQIWLGIQSTENTCKGSSCQFLWLPLWCQWCPPRPRKGQCCTCLTSTHKHHQMSRVLGPSHIPESLHPWSVHPDCPSARAAQEGHRLHMEPHLQCHFWVGQGSCHQWHHSQVLWPITSSDNTSWCLAGRPWCSTPAKWQTCSLCQQGPHQNWMPICKHRERS